MVLTSSSRAKHGAAIRSAARRLIQCGAAGASFFLVTLGTTSAAAQGKVITISEVTIVGRVQKPIAAVDVSRIQPKMTLGELRQPFLDRIEEAIYRAPF
jgi:hypothetical protein